jgi:hypothetical protein
MKEAEQQTGKRLLDVFDIHYYSQDCSTDDGKLQAARSLYDPTYQENSWLQPTFKDYFPLLPKLQESIEQNYPGTKLAISEYNLADIGNEKTTGKNVISAIAEAEALGAFADNNVYFATYWGTIPECPYVASAINLYTNYDGEGNAFGDTLVKASTEDVSKSAAYAAIDGSDDSNVDVILSNKNKTEAEKAVITVDGSSKNYKSAVVYAVTADHSDIRIAEVNNNVSGNKVEIELPPLSVAHIVLSDKESDKEVYEAPDISVKETEYKVSDLKTDSYGNVLIPLGDKEHLKEIVFGVNTYSKEGSSYYSGGGGLGFAQLVPEEGGAEVWGYKPVNYANGDTQIVVPFSDGIFNIDKKEVKASVNGTDAQWQPNWWAFSEKHEDGSDVVVEYTTVKLVYEYDNSGTPVEKIPGDVDSNGVVNAKDAALLAKWLTKQPVMIDLTVADVNKDDKINVFDLIMIKRKIKD